MRALLLLALAAGCTPIEHAFVCHGDATCAGSVQGTCQPNGWCSFPDGLCASGQKYGEFAGDHLANMCVGATIGDGGGTGDGGGGDGGTTCPIGDTCCAGMTCGAMLTCTAGNVCEGCVTAIALGDNHGCALESNGTIWCWGTNDHGQLGDGTTTTRPAAVQVVDNNGVAFSDFVAVTAGANHTCGLTNNGVARCWGDGTDGELGVGTNLAVNSVPASVGIQPIGSIAAGGRHTCASIGSGGMSGAFLVWCWGANDAGQIASPSNPSGKNMPVAAVDKAGVQLLGTTLTGGLSHTCMLKMDGTTWCWGSDTMGELGDGASAASSAPVQVAVIGTHATALAAGSHFTCALLDDGTVDCFGQNDRAQSGQPDSATPVAVATSVGLAGGTAVAVGATLGCARLAGATLDCWGDDATVAAVKSGVGAIAVGANDRCTARADGVDCVVADPRVSCP
ncbi:MAG TPA: hypothetical protein VIA18_17615 [Polyangia bacterium]|nr:hypothetical protein [Polyangia bacterium]